MSEEEYDYDIDMQMPDDYIIKRLSKALEIACEVIKSDTITVSEEYQWLLSNAIRDTLESYFISKADKKLNEDIVIKMNAVDVGDLKSGIKSDDKVTMYGKMYNYVREDEHFISKKV